MKPIGGSEILYYKLSSLLDLSKVNLILSVCSWRNISNTKPNILWQHLDVNQQAVEQMQNEAFVDSLDAIVFVSHWQYEQYRKKYNIPGKKCFVIKNAIDSIEIHSKPKDVKLIYTSMPDRGLELLIDAYELLKNKVEVEIYSGTKIYGQQYHEATKNKYTALYKRIKKLNLQHFDYAPNDKVIDALKRSHILAYPSIFQETSCLSAIQALAAGCTVVTTNFGALPETCCDWATFVPLDNRQDFVKRFASTLDETILEYRYNEDQVRYYNKYWTWNTRIKEWEKLFGKLC